MYRGSKKKEYTINAIITAYSKAETCPYNECITASGTKPKANRTIACPRNVPFGTKIVILDQEYICEDRTHYRFDGRFDIFVDSYDDAIQFGKQKLDIKIYDQ